MSAHRAAESQGRQVRIEGQSKHCELFVSHTCAWDASGSRLLLATAGRPWSPRELSARVDARYWPPAQFSREGDAKGGALSCALPPSPGALGQVSPSQVGASAASIATATRLAEASSARQRGKSVAPWQAECTSAGR